jgi:putative ABC transport system ATP-binding protein
MPARERLHIDARGLVKRHKVGGGLTLTALDDVSLSISAGTTVALAGPSGSGKSTLLQLLGAMDSPDAGTLSVGGRELTSQSRRQLADYRRTVGYVFQRFNLLPALTVLDNVLAPVLPYRVAFDKPERAMELLDAVGMSDRHAALPSRLSGGQQQRVAIARALINEPSIVLADEPTGNLDSVNGAEILDILLGLREEHGITIVVATHDAAVAARCDRYVRLRDGKIIEDREVVAGQAPESMLVQGDSSRS